MAPVRCVLPGIIYACAVKIAILIDSGKRLDSEL